MLQEAGLGVGVGRFVNAILWQRHFRFVIVSGWG